MERNDADILPVTTSSSEPEIDYTAELVRKSIHLCSLGIPVVYYFISKSTALEILLPMTAAFLIVDVLRYFHKPTTALFYRLFRKLLRPHEVNGKQKTLNGATYMLISATLCVLLFPKLIVLTSFTILIVSDTSAALIGRRFGTHKFYHKTLEGSSAFFISAILVVLCTPKIEYLPAEYLIGIAGGLVGMLAEIASFNIIDDNIAIPVASGGAMWLLYRLLLPSLNVYMLS